MYIYIQQVIIRFSIRIISSYIQKMLQKKLYSIVIFNPLLLKILNICFFIISESGLDMFSKQLKPSFLCKPILCSPNS